MRWQIQYLQDREDQQDLQDLQDSQTLYLQEIRTVLQRLPVGYQPQIPAEDDTVSEVFNESEN